MDFRMEKSSWVMILVILAIMLYLVLGGVFTGLPFIGYVHAFGLALLSTLILIALMCIPVIIYCYFAKVIPDIDYSVNVAFAVAIVGIISEFIF